jgi:hypothetical protein
VLQVEGVVLPLALRKPRAAPPVPAWRAPPALPGEPPFSHRLLGRPLGRHVKGKGGAPTPVSSYAVRVRVATCLARPRARGVLGGLTWRTSFPPFTRTPRPAVGRYTPPTS